MSLLPLSLFESRSHPLQNHSPSDISQIIFLSLPVVDLERIHLGCHKWLCIINNLAKEVVRRQWPHLYAQYDHPLRNWIPLYCCKLRALENIVTGRFQMIRLQSDRVMIGFGMDLGKLAVKDCSNNVMVLSLRDALLYKGWQRGWGQTYTGRLFADCTRGVQLWNMQTGENLVNFTGKTFFQIIKYENILLAVDDTSETSHLFVYESERKGMRKLLPPPGMKQLQYCAYGQKEQTNNFPSRQVAFLWTDSLNKSKCQNHAVAVYRLETSGDLLEPHFTFKLPDHFVNSFTIRSVHRHEGFTLVNLEPEEESKVQRWAIFDKDNKELSYSGDISIVVWMPGKIVFASYEKMLRCMYVLDTSTGTLGQPLHAPFIKNIMNDCCWMRAIDAKHVAFLGRDRDHYALYVVDVRTQRCNSFIIPGVQNEDFKELIDPVFFDGERLVWNSTRASSLDLCVLDFTVANPSSPQIKKIAKAADYKDLLVPWRGDSFRWESRKVTWSRGLYKYWWITAAIVILGVIYYSSRGREKNEID